MPAAVGWSVETTKQRTFKRRVRARMAKTGERYGAARRMLIARREAPAFEPPVSEARLVQGTGHGWRHWLGVLDGWGAAGRSHTEIARRLREERGVAGWWSQAITVGYERARGRAPGQRPDGFAVGATRTVAVPVERLFDAFEDPAVRGRWLPGAELRTRTATAPRTARHDRGDGSTRVHVGFERLGEARSRVAIEHVRLPDAAAAGEVKAWWRVRLTALNDLLEGGEAG